MSIFDIVRREASFLWWLLYIHAMKNSHSIFRVWCSLNIIFTVMNMENFPLLKRRALLMRAIRSFFNARDYLEVETPYLVTSPGEEVHLRCFRTFLEHHDGSKEVRYLHTSPEFAMKKLVAKFKEPIFQIARVWRNGEKSKTHHPEFTLLEWYRPYASMVSLMDETESLLKAILPPQIAYAEGILHLDRPFERLTMQEAFFKYVGIDILEDIGNAPLLAKKSGVSLRRGEEWEDLFFRLLLEKIEPYIGRERPIFLTHWPAQQAALAKISSEDPRTALRFELYAAGLELANAFEELTDPYEQRKRFEEDRKRRLLFSPDHDWSIDENLLAALEEMPLTSGIALGVDRLIMLATSAPRIEDVLFLS